VKDTSEFFKYRSRGFESNHGVRGLNLSLSVLSSHLFDFISSHNTSSVRLDLLLFDLSHLLIVSVFIFFVIFLNLSGLLAFGNISQNGFSLLLGFFFISSRFVFLRDDGDVFVKLLEEVVRLVLSVLNGESIDLSLNINFLGREVSGLLNLSHLGRLLGFDKLELLHHISSTYLVEDGVEQAPLIRHDSPGADVFDRLLG
jgi:hypothetical protein